MFLLAAKDLGALIRDQRGRMGLTQQQLADRVGVSRVWLVALEKGKPSAQVGLVFRTLMELGLTIRADRKNTLAGEINLNDIVDRPGRNSKR